MLDYRLAKGDSTIIFSLINYVCHMSNPEHVCAHNIC